MVISWIMFPNSGKYGRWALSGQHLANPSTHPPDKSARKSKTAKLPICPPMGSDWDKMARRIEGRLIDIDQTWPFNVNLIVGNIKVLYLKRWHFDVFLSSPPLSHSKIRMQICRRWESLLAFIAPLLNASCTMWMYIYIIPSPLSYFDNTSVFDWVILGWISVGWEKDSGIRQILISLFARWPPP